MIIRANCDVYLPRSAVLALLVPELEPFRDHFADVEIPTTANELQQLAYIRARAVRLVAEGVLTKEIVAACDLNSWRSP